jgi:hypothetical protein
MAIQQSQEAFVARMRDFARLFKSQYGDVAAANALYYGQVSDYANTLADEAILASFPDASSEDITALRTSIGEMMYIVGQMNGLISARLEHVAALA